ncbi:hypothetical protein M413DRAFT_446123 [Hebeloma cylindrosporum]|uniref:Transmembrane protein n=1 Tax=Hebeloma cylindrosporum TaxID=76867 RepID=A0A0C3CAW6_HEBCY|nr:hypothetical protein M413DRAFT_446123 [Hebeloma cylindrosporum h7]
MGTRWVVVDDTNSGIRYTGPWFQANGQNDDLGNFGPPFLRTSHGVNENASLCYTFTGSRVMVVGTSKVTPVAGAMDPSWECFVDNVSIGSKPPISFPENNWVFCEANSLSNGQHTITVRATVRNQNTFWFDRILYSPSSSVNLDTSLILVDATDSSVQYGSGWQDMRDIGKLTLQGGAKVTVTFSGTSLKWFSLIPSDMPHASTSATYSVDGGTPVTFFLAGLAAGAMEPYNQLFFEASGLSAGQHRIEVVHGGNSQTTPLSLSYMVIQNAPAPAGSVPPPLPPNVSSSSSASSPASSSSGSSDSAGSTTYDSLSPTGFPGSSSTPAPSNSSGADASSPSFGEEHKGASTGAIAGGAVGGAVVLIALILLLLLLRRRRKRNAMDPQLNQEKSSPNIIEPFSGPPSAPVSFPDGGSSSYSPVPNGPSPGGKSGHIRQYPSQSTVPTGPRAPRSRNSAYSSSQASGSLADQRSTPANSTSQLLGSSKAREAGELGDLPPTNLVSAQSEIPVASTSQSPSATAPQRLMRHEDSGIRLPPRESMLELPPMYTPD